MKPWLAGLMVVALLGITLLHRPYPAETWMLARKHYQLWQSERALAASDLPDSAAAASAAIGLDQESALARVALARADLAAGDRQAALGALDQAVAVLPAHPYAHLLRGALRREQGDLAGAREDLGFEKASLEDLQAWAWRSFAPFAPAPAALDVGGGLDLGFVQGFSLPEQSFRWSSAEARVVLAASGAPNARLRMRLAGGRPPGAPQAVVTVLLGGRAIGQLAPASAWGTYELPVPADLRSGPVVVTLRGDTFRPRDFDRASPDARWLGVMVGRVEIVTP